MKKIEDFQEAVLHVLSIGYINEWHDGNTFIGETIILEEKIFRELLKKDYIDMASGNHLYTTYRPTSKASNHTFIL